MKREDFVAMARSYLGTPFHHQGRQPGVGLDCAGVVVVACWQCDHAVQDVIAYGRIPFKGLLEKSVAEYCDEIPVRGVLAGDVLLFTFREDPHHLAVVSHVAPIRLIHAYSQVNKVVENSLDAYWQKRLCKCYRIRGIE
jgi:cell wall-associated NlpC family hydrolase